MIKKITLISNTLNDKELILKKIYKYEIYIFGIKVYTDTERLYQRVEDKNKDKIGF
jgi:hypothetical protein